MNTLTFLGAARTVTGSKYLVKTGSRQFLVDCGLFQGLKELRERNWQPLPVEPSSISTRWSSPTRTSITPATCRGWCSDGFRGRVFCTPGTADLCRDHAARRRPAGRGRRARGEPRRLYQARAGPAALHGDRRAARARRICSPSATSGRCRSARGVTRRLPRRGPPARLGVRADDARRDRAAARSSSAATSAATTGRCCRIPRGSRRPTSCWSNRPTAIACTSRTTTASGWRRSSRRRSQRGGKVIIPAFAVGRVEEVIYWLKRLEDARRIPVAARSTSTARWPSRR